SVHPHEIKAIFRQPVGDTRRNLRRRKVSFAGQVHGPEPLSSDTWEPKVTITHLDEAVLAGRRVEEKPRIGERVWRCVPSQVKRHPLFRIHRHASQCQGDGPKLHRGSLSGSNSPCRGDLGAVMASKRAGFATTQLSLT